MKKRIFLVTMGVVLFCLNSFAQKDGLAVIGKDDLKAYMTFFASDEMAGRETGSGANETAALYIKTNLMRLGLKPSPSTGDYLQKIPMFSARVDHKSSFLKINGTQGEEISFTDSTVALMTPSMTMEATGNVVYAGYGYSDTITGYNDFNGIDLSGKIVLMMTRTPESAYMERENSMFQEQIEGPKLGQVFMRGPKAILIVYDPRNRFHDAYDSRLAEMISSNSVTLSGRQDQSIPLQLLFITQHSADLLLKSTGYTLSQMQERIRTEGKPVSVEIPDITATIRTSVDTSSFYASNVIGIIEGSDPVLRNECIIYTAHFDHIGKKGNGEVNNGADDNASGSMALLEVAEAFMKLKKNPLRTIVFAWVNGEEKGLLGSYYYTTDPVIPLENTLVDINLDMVGRSKMTSDTGKFAGFDLDVTQKGEIMVYTAHESSELLQMMTQSAKKVGLRVTDKGKDMSFGGSDHESFTVKGIPALFFHSGIHADLHSMRDDVEKIDYDKIEKVSEMAFLVGYKVANQRKRITVNNPQ
ncbi:MAG: M20/M25/M40 family metallo-hydrolase [Bacteroidales bacterium]|jgi:hypothetical protein|nr:M20/M25/M40 family metallo-hydrolase [Bacteroidales bacterium]